jgi:hypothetical protein
MRAYVKQGFLAIFRSVTAAVRCGGLLGAKGVRGLLVVLMGVLSGASGVQAASTSIDISSFVGNDLTNYTGGANYPQNGGPLTVGGVPFTLATIAPSSHTAIIQNGNVPETFSIPVNLSGVRTVYSLINSANGACGTTIGELDYVSASSGTFVYLLTENDNVRDHFQDGFCNTAPNVAATANFGPDRLDMQRVNLPASFSADTLVRIDFKGYGLGGASGRPFVAALTASTDALPELPASSPWGIVAIAGLLAVLGMWTVQRRQRR